MSFFSTLGELSSCIITNRPGADRRWKREAGGFAIHFSVLFVGANTNHVRVHGTKARGDEMDDLPDHMWCVFL